ncbi:hypothetical protein BKA70DRAFT_1105713 [Coprinopsis sp. MPI-PUGE-AT-0042]|nr:hypothetical protein BKA70DRAFT_1105713 [Coprinopsis sp. MPI-PUGE-AT-0042]
MALHAIPILATCARLWHRKRRRQIWWDDFWVAMALGMLLWLVGQTIGMSYLSNEWLGRHPLTQSWLTWLAYLTNPTTIWLARFSIIVGVIRLVPQGRNRAITKVSFFVFVLMWMAIVVGTVTMCGKPSRLPRCHYSRRANAIYLTSNLISTTWLLTWPVYLLFRMKLKRHERKPILACFLGAVSLFAVDTGHAVNLVKQEKDIATGVPPNWKSAVVTGNLQILLAFLCANSLVLVMYIYRVVRQPGDNHHETIKDDGTCLCQLSVQLHV